jgi:hypothetical protein
VLIGSVVGQNNMEDMSPDLFETPACQKRLIGLSNLEQSCTNDQGPEGDMANQRSGEGRLRRKSVFDVTFDDLAKIMPRA